MPLTSPPEQKAEPAPVINSTPTSGFSPQVFIIVRSAGVRWSDNELRASGRLRVMIATRSRITQRSSWVPVSMVMSVVVILNSLFIHLLRHCERSEAVQFFCCGNGLPRCARNDGKTAQNFSTHGRNSISQVQALRGCCSTFQ